MEHDCKGEHHWGRRAHAELLASSGRRIIYDCNDCLAIKVTFHMGYGQAETKHETIVEDHT
jgi:hypothetical protein